MAAPGNGPARKIPAPRDTLIQVDAKLSGILRELRTGMERIYGNRLRGLILFGSHARGDAVEGSDIDVMVLLEGEVDAGAEISRTSELRSVLSLKHDVVISCVYIPEAEYRDGQSPLLLNARREGIAA